MHNNNSKEYHYKELLKVDIEHKFGNVIKYSKECRLLSRQIYEATGRQLSVSTIKRFFGLIQSPFHPSKFTLDTLSEYLGKENWVRFKEVRKKEVAEKSHAGNADLLKESFEGITKTSCNSLARKARFNPGRFIRRTFAEAFFEEFIQSEKTATLLIAPGGYGKSAVLLQWMRAHFSGKDSRFKDDVVCLIDGGIFFTFYNQANQNELLAQLLDFDSKTLQKLYERQKSNPQKEKYFLIIDDVDCVFSVRQKYYLFVENIMRLIMLFKENPLVKIILTCRPENLDVFTSLVLNNPLLADFFFNTNFLQKNQHDNINVPLFSSDELKRVLGKNKSSFSYYHLSLYYPDVIKLISTPSFFSYFIHNATMQLEDFKEIEFVNRLIQHFYCSHPFAEEKQQLITKFLGLCRKKINYTNVSKDLLLDGTECRLAYQELIKAGLFYEYLDSSSKPEVQLNVRFANNEIYEYLLAWTLVKERGLSLSLINVVFANYKNIIHLQYSLLKWIVKIACFEGNISFLKQLYQSLESHVNVYEKYRKESVPGALFSIHTAFLECFRTNSKLNEVLLPEFAKAELGQKMFFEVNFDLDNLMNFPEKGLLAFIQNNSKADGKMIFHFVRFMKGFYSHDFKLCALEFENISGIDYGSLSSSLSLGYYFSTWFLYAFLNDYQKREEMLDKFLSTSQHIRKQGLQSLQFNPGFEFFVVYHLNVCNFFDECRRVSEYITGPDYSIPNKSSGFYQFFKLCYARSLLHTDEQEEALKLYRQVNFNDFPFHMKHFMQINVNLAKFDFLKYLNKTAEALILLHETRLLAKQMGYRYFVVKADELEFKLLKANSDFLP